MERGAKSKKDGASKAEPKSTKRKTDPGSSTPRKSSKRRDEGNAGKKTPRRETPESARGDNHTGPRREKVEGDELERPRRDMKERNTEKLFEYVKKGQTYNIEEFIRLGADVNGRDDEGRTPLIRAAELRNNTVQAILMAKNVKVNAADKLKRMALHFESAHGDTESVKQLLAHGADIDARDCEGHTPLHFAVNRNHLSTVDILVFCGADGRAKDYKRASPESICPPGAMQTLLQESRDVIYAIRHGYISIHRTTLSSNALVHLDSIGLRIKTPTDFSKADVCILCRRVRPEFSRCGLGPINKELLISDTFEFRLSGSRFNGQVKMLIPMYTKPEPYEEVHIKTSKNPKLRESSKELVLYEREETSNQWICSVDIDLKEISSFVLVTRPRVEHFKVGQQGGTFVSDVDSFIKIDIPQKSFSDKGDLTLEVIPRPAYTNEELGVTQIEVASVSNIYEVNHSRHEQPQNEVTVTLPLPRDYQQENTKLYVLSRRNPTEDESELSLWEILSINPDQAYGRMTFKTSHFSSEVAVAVAQPRSDIPKPAEDCENSREATASHNGKRNNNKSRQKEQEPKKLNATKEGSKIKDESGAIKSSKKAHQESKTGNIETKDKGRRGSNVSQTSNRSQLIKGSHSGSFDDKVQDGNKISEIKTAEHSEKQSPPGNEMKKRSSPSSSKTSLKNENEKEDTFWDEEDEENEKNKRETDVIQKNNQVEDKEHKDEATIRPQSASELPKDEENHDKYGEEESRQNQSKAFQDGLNSSNEGESNHAVDGNKKSTGAENKENFRDEDSRGSKTSLKSIHSSGSNASKTSVRKEKLGYRSTPPRGSSRRSSLNESIQDITSETSSISRRSQKMERDKERNLHREIKRAAAIVYDKAKKRQCKVSFVVMLNGNLKDEKYETLVECTIKDPYKRLSFWETEGFQDQKPSFPERKEFNVIPKTIFEFPVSEAAKVVNLQKLEFHPKRKDDNFIRFEIERTEQTKSDALLKIMKKADNRPDNSKDEVLGLVTLHLDGVDAVVKKSSEKTKEVKEFTNDSFLEKISNQLSDEWYKLGIFLGLAKSTIDKKDIPMKERKFKMLKKWRNNCRTREDRGVRSLTLALNRAGRRDIEEFVIKELDSWLEKHKKEEDDFSKWLKRARSEKWEVPEGKVMPYSDEFLMCLVEQLGLREDFLIRLGLISPQISNVKDPNFYPTPERQMFELLCQAKRRYATEFEFFKDLDTNLGELDLIDVQTWLRNTTAEWVTEHETDENMVVDQLQSFLEEVEHEHFASENTDKKQDSTQENTNHRRQSAYENKDQRLLSDPETTDQKQYNNPETTDQKQHPAPETTDQKQHPAPETTDQKQHPAPETTDQRQHPAPETTDQKQYNNPEITDQRQHPAPETTDQRQHPAPETTDQRQHPAPVDNEQKQDTSTERKQEGPDGNIVNNQYGPEHDSGLNKKHPTDGPDHPSDESEGDTEDGYDSTKDTLQKT